MKYFVLDLVWMFTLNLVRGRSILKLVWRHTGERNGSASVGKSLLSRESYPFPESDRPVPGKAPLHAPRSPSRTSAAILSPGTPRADVWGGRGTVVVLRGAGWRTVEPMPSGACWNRHIFKDQFGHHSHYHHYGAALYNKDGTMVLKSFCKKMKNVSCEYDRGVVEPQLCKLIDAH